MSGLLRRMIAKLPLTPALDAWQADYRRDPLAHPAIDRMSLEELADLPAAELRARSRA